MHYLFVFVDYSHLLLLVHSFITLSLGLCKLLWSRFFRFRNNQNVAISLIFAVSLQIIQLFVDLLLISGIVLTRNIITELTSEQITQLVNHAIGA